MRRLLVALAIALVLAPHVLAAQGPHIQPFVVLLPASTRARALGNAHAAVPDNDAIFYNPSLLGASSARGMSVAAERFGGSSTLGTLSMSMAAAPGGLGIGVQMLDYGATCDSCAVTPDASEPALVSRGPIAGASVAVSVGYGARVKGIYVGLAGKYLEQRVGVARDGTGALDAGLGTSRGRFLVALAAQNLGHGVQIAGTRSALPHRFSLGVAAQPVAIGMMDLSAALAIARERGGRVRSGIGVEVAYVPVDGISFGARAGVRRADRGVSPLSLGAAVTVDRLVVEYAFQALDAAGDIHRAGLRVR